MANQHYNSTTLVSYSDAFPVGYTILGALKDGRYVCVQDIADETKIKLQFITIPTAAKPFSEAYRLSPFFLNPKY